VKRRLYEIQMRSLRTCIEHLHTLDLDDMAECAAQYGTEPERDLIQNVREALGDIPKIYPKDIDT
jgi:hypothetical protein